MGVQGSPKTRGAASSGSRLLIVRSTAYRAGRTQKRRLRTDDRGGPALDHPSHAPRLHEGPMMEARMSDDDNVRDALERLEWADGQRPDAPGDRWQTTRRTALAGGAAGLASLLISACGGGNGN